MNREEARTQLMDVVLDLHHLVTDVDSIRKELDDVDPTVNRVLLKLRDAYGDLATHMGVPRAIPTTPAE